MTKGPKIQKTGRPKVFYLIFGPIYIVPMDPLCYVRPGCVLYDFKVRKKLY